MATAKVSWAANNQTIYTSREIVTGDRNERSLAVRLWYGRHRAEQAPYFSITAEIVNKKTGVVESAGCLHSEIEEFFPELAYLIKWHLCSDEGPLHYISNTLFLAGNKDCFGGEKGKQKTNKKGLPMWSLQTKPQRMVCQHEEPAPVVLQYEPVVHEGKERELDAARRSAVWFDATDEELCSDNLKELLEARLPQLVKEFLLDMVEAGFDVEFAEV